MLTVAWLLIAALGLWWWSWELRQRRADLMALTALALAVRFWAPAVPHDINPRLLDLWYGQADAAASYGVGMSAYARVLFLVLPRTEASVLTMGAVLGALTVPLVVRLADALGLSRSGAGVAGLFVAASPMMVRLSHTDAQQVPEVLLLVAGLWALARWRRFGDARGPWVAALAFGVGVHLRSESVVVPLVALGLWGLPTAGGGARRALPTAGSWGPWALFGALAALQVGALLASLGLGAGTHPRLPPLWVQGQLAHPLWVHGPRHLHFVDPAYTAPPLVLLMVLGWARGPLPWLVRCWLAVGAVLLGALVWGPIWTPVDQVSLALARHQLRAVPFAAVLLGAGVEAVRAWGVGWWRGVVVLVAGCLAWRLPVAWVETTHSAEYSFVRASLPSLPSDCTIISYRYPRDGGLQPPAHLSANLGLAHRWQWVPPVVGGWEQPPCVIWYRPANCHVATLGDPDPASRATGRVEEACAAFEARYVLEPVVTADLPARTYVFDLYTVDPVPVGFFRVVGRR